MFVLAVLGNLTYGVAILVRSLEEVYLVRHLPWIFGSLGVIALDLTVSFENIGRPKISIYTMVQKLFHYKIASFITLILHSPRRILHNSLLCASWERFTS